MVSDLNMTHGEMLDFVSFLLLGFTLVMSLRHFDFETHLNTLIFFHKKKDVRFDYVLSNRVYFGVNFSFEIV